MTRATAAIGDLPIRRGLEAAWASSTDGRPHSAHLTCRQRTEKSPILWQAGTLLTVTGTVGSLCHAACATQRPGVRGLVQSKPRGCSRARRCGAQLSLMGCPLYFSDPACLEHETTGGHPERPARITAIERSLAERGWLGYEVRQAQPASREMLVAVHSAEYVDAVRSMSDRGAGAFDKETVVSAGSYRAAAHASGAACATVEALLAEGGLQRNQAARPPHARGQYIRILPVQPRCGGESSRAGLTGRTTGVHLRLGRAPRRRNQRHLPRHQRRALREHPPIRDLPRHRPHNRRRSARGRGLLDQPAGPKRDRTRTRGSRCSSTS